MVGPLAEGRHGGLHVGRVERTGDLEGDHPRTGRRVGAERVESVERAGGHDLTRAVDVGGRQPVAVDRGKDLVGVTTEHRAHAGRRGGAGLGHGATSQGDEAHGIRLRQHSGPCGGGDLADGVAGERTGTARGDGIRLVGRAGQRAQGEEAGPHEQRLGDGGVLDGVLVGGGAVRDEVDLGRLGMGGQPVTQSGQLEPRVEEAGGLGALTRADENDHPSSVARAP